MVPSWLNPTDCVDPVDELRIQFTPIKVALKRILSILYCSKGLPGFFLAPCTHGKNKNDPMALLDFAIYIGLN